MPNISMNGGRPSILTPIILMIASGWLAVLGATQTFAATADTPPVGDVAIEPPLNEGPNTQQKLGSLLIGSDTSSSKLCLNADASKTESDLDNCVSSWSDLSGKLPQYLGLNTTPVSLDIATYPDKYVSQSAGFVDVQAINNQAAANVYAPVVSGNYTATAVYANGGDSNWAGSFNGRVYVRAASDNQPGKICLGPDVSQVCISSWNDIKATQSYVRRFDPLPSPLEPQGASGGAGGASISGHASFGSAVLGDTKDIPVSVTCGDGVCSQGTNSNNETSDSCTIDCAAVPSPAQFTVALTQNATFPQPQVKLSMIVGPQQPPAVTVLVVRSSPNLPIVFRPVNGTAYAAGTTIGNDTIAAVYQTTGGARELIDILPSTVSGTTYYYQVYQANAYPRYSTPTAAVAITPVKLTVGINEPTKASVVGTIGNIACPSSSCAALYNSGVTETLTVNSIATGYKVTGWNYCDQWTLTTCTVTLNGDKSVVLNVAPSDGDGDGGGGGRIGD